ncbi:MAG: Na+/H+ antiporter NhaC, partial [Psychrobacillus psychrotolerans]
TLGVGVAEYAAFAVLNFIVPIISIIYAMTGFTIQKISEAEKLEILGKDTAEV